MHVLWLSPANQLVREIKRFANAFERAGATLILPEPQMSPDFDIRRLLEKCPERPALIVHPEPYVALLPRGLTEVDIPTVGFHIDVYAYTHRRLFYSMLFDHVVLLHPGFEDTFRRAGHPSPLVLPFAADPTEFFDSDERRVYEIASVGRLHPNLYKSRMEILTALSREFRMNQWDRFVEFDKVPPVYRASKIVINIPRDDYPIDVSMRFAEAMACGALFLTRAPTEMTTLGFEENVHYVAYRDRVEIPAIVRKYIADEPARLRIARAGRDKVLREHTYDVRVAALLAHVNARNEKLQAPARSWTPSKVHLAYLDYFAANGAFDCAYRDLWAIAKGGAPELWDALKLVSRSRASRLLSHVRFRGTSFWPSAPKP